MKRVRGDDDDDDDYTSSFFIGGGGLAPPTSKSEKNQSSINDRSRLPCEPTSQRILGNSSFQEKPPISPNELFKLRQKGEHMSYSITGPNNSTMSTNPINSNMTISDDARVANTPSNNNSSRGGYYKTNNDTNCSFVIE